MDGEIETGGEATEVESQGQTTDAATASAGAGASAAQTSAPATSQPQQPQGPDWNSLGVPFDQAQQRLQYFQELEQRYKSDPAWQQKYDQLWNGQQQQQGHPYDWMNGDEKRLEALRQQGEQHPDFPRLQAEFTNFFHNQVGHMSQLVNHPKVVEAAFQAQAPMIQDLAQRMIQQAMQPITQYLNHQANQQFNNQYGKAFQSLPKQVVDLYKAGRFGQPNSREAIINAVEAGKILQAQQAAAVDGAPVEPEQPKTPAVNKNTAVNKTPPAAPQQGIGRKKDAGLEEAAKAWRAALDKK